MSLISPWFNWKNVRTSIWESRRKHRLESRLRHKLVKYVVLYFSLHSLEHEEHTEANIITLRWVPSLLSHSKVSIFISSLQQIQFTFRSKRRWGDYSPRQIGFFFFNTMYCVHGITLWIMCTCSDHPMLRTLAFSICSQSQSFICPFCPELVVAANLNVVWLVWRK